MILKIIYGYDVVETPANKKEKKETDEGSC